MYGEPLPHEEPKVRILRPSRVTTYGIYRTKDTHERKFEYMLR